jgi:hypothetical protein
MNRSGVERIAQVTRQTAAMAVEVPCTDGAISGSCHLDATQYRAFVQGSGQWSINE